MTRASGASTYGSRCVSDTLTMARAFPSVRFLAPEFMTDKLLAPLRPDQDALTPLFQAHVDDAMLREIAAADYGWKADECYILLQPMLKAGLSRPMTTICEKCWN